MLRLNKCVKNKNLVSSLFLSSLRLSLRVNNFIPKLNISNFCSKRDGNDNYEYNYYNYSKYNQDMEHITNKYEKYKNDIIKQIK